MNKHMRSIDARDTFLRQACKSTHAVDARNTFLRRALKVTLASAVGVSMLATVGCSSGLEVDSSDAEQTEVVVYNWGEYIAEDTIANFEKAYPQYKVVYREFETNETMYPNLTNSYDVIVPSDYMVCRLIRENKLQKLDMTKLPNVTKYMDPLIKNITFDQDKSLSDSVLEYAAPYMSCSVGLVYDANKVDLDPTNTDPQTVWGVLTDPQYKNQVGMYDSMRESIGVALNYLGYNLNTLDANELDAAQTFLVNQKKTMAPSYGVDNLKDKIASGELVAAEAWSGDFQIIQDRIDELGNTDKIDLQFALPKGSNWSTDMMCIPSNAKNVAGALAFINYMYDPDIALANCEYVGYSTPNVAAREKLPDDIKNNTSYYPDADTFNTLQMYFSSSEIEETYSAIWNTVKATS